MPGIDYGIVKPGRTLYIPYNTYDSNDPQASVTQTGLALADIKIHKNGGVTERASTAGFTLLDTDGTDFDAITGLHGISIDLSDNTTAGFYEAGAEYWVTISSVTVDAATVNATIATFRIGYPDAILNTTIATLSTQTSFTLTAGPAEDDALNGRWCLIHDIASAVQVGHALITDYVGSTKTVTLAAGTTFTVAAGDNISIMGLAPLQPTTIGNTLDVTATGAAGIDWGNVENPTTTVDLSATDINLVDTATTVTSSGLSAAAVDAIWDEPIAGHLTAGTTGLSETLGSAALVDSTMTGTPTSTTFTFTGGSTTNNFYNDQLVYILSGTGVGQVRPVLSSSYAAGTTTITVDEAFAETPAASDRFAILVSHVHPKSQIADVIWDEATSGHSTAGTTGKALTDVLEDTGTTLPGVLGTPSDLGGGATLADNNSDMAGATFATSTDSLEAIRDRGDTAWITGGGGGLTQSINPVLAVPPIIDLAGTASVRIGIILTNTLDDLPTTAEITPGTITIARKAQGGTSWTNVVSAAAMTEQDGFVYYDEIFDSGSGYAAGDVIRMQFESVSVTADANTYNITGATGVYVYSYIIEPMRGTDSAATASALSTAQTDITAILADTADMQPKLGTPAGASISADIATIDSNVDAILVDTGTTLPATLSTIDSNVSAVLTDTGTTIPAQITALNDISVADILTTQMTESYAADGSAPTITQALMLIQQTLGDFAISGTTLTVKKVDGTTTAATFTLDDGTSPTSITRAT